MEEQVLQRVVANGFGKKMFLKVLQSFDLQGIWEHKF